MSRPPLDQAEKNRDVRAGTIVRLSRTLSVAPTDDPPAPQNLIESIHAELRAKAEHHRRRLMSGHSKTGAIGVYIAASKMLQTFELMMQNVPRGFVLAPVFYERQPEEGKDRPVFREFSQRVRRPFLQYLAVHCAEELRALGLDDGALRRMATGQDPAAKGSMKYWCSIDHIIERGGCGRWSRDRVEDPRQPGAGKVFQVNAFGNLMLLPEHVHAYKTLLIKMQGCHDWDAGAGRWVLTLVPEVTDGHSGFVAARQDPGHPFGGLFKKSGPSRVAAQAMDALRDLHRILAAFRALTVTDKKTGKTQKDFAAASQTRLHQRILMHAIVPAVGRAVKNLNTLGRHWNAFPAADDALQALVALCRRQGLLRLPAEVAPNLILKEEIRFLNRVTKQLAGQTGPKPLTAVPGQKIL